MTAIEANRTRNETIAIQIRKNILGNVKVRDVAQSSEPFSADVIVPLIRGKRAPE